jgi:hypothetical protein
MTAHSYALLLLACGIAGIVAKPVVARDGLATSAPAATTVPSGSSAGVDLFKSETVQLTDEVLREIDAQADGADVLALVGFEIDTDSALASQSRHSGACKVFPGDKNYPQPETWSLFDGLLGGALIKTIPIAAPCYKSSGVYDEVKCADVSNRFTIADLQ